MPCRVWRLPLLCRSIDQLNRERKLQQSAAGSELRVLEDQYYSALRKNLEISAACQAVEDDMTLLQARLGKLAPPADEQDAAAAGAAAAAAAGAGDGQEQQEQQQQPAENGIENGVEAAADEPMGQ